MCTLIKTCGNVQCFKVTYGTIGCNRLARIEAALQRPLSYQRDHRIFTIGNSASIPEQVIQAACASHPSDPWQVTLLRQAPGPLGHYQFRLISRPFPRMIFSDAVASLVLLALQHIRDAKKRLIFLAETSSENPQPVTKNASSKPCHEPKAPAKTAGTLHTPAGQHTIVEMPGVALMPTSNSWRVTLIQVCAAITVVFILCSYTIYRK